MCHVKKFLASFLIKYESFIKIKSNTKGAFGILTCSAQNIRKKIFLKNVFLINQPQCWIKWSFLSELMSFYIMLERKKVAQRQYWV